MKRSSLRIVILLSVIGAIAILAPTYYYVWQTERKVAEAEQQGLPNILAELHQKYGGEKYSQGYEEWLIRDFFQDRRDGFFLDVGAYDYKDLSNTYFLESQLGWSGIAVEPQVKFRADYERYRPKTQFVAMFVSDKSDEEIKFFVPERENRASAVQGAMSEESGVNEVEVPTITLNDLLSKYQVSKIDFLNMDIELWEPKALAGFDIDKYRPELVCIEAHPPVRKEIEDYFAAHHYVKITKYLVADRRNFYYTPAAGS